jgi:protein-arginine kinase
MKCNSRPVLSEEVSEPVAVNCNSVRLQLIDGGYRVTELLASSTAIQQKIQHSLSLSFQDRQPPGTRCYSRKGSEVQSADFPASVKSRSVLDTQPSEPDMSMPLQL